MVDKLAHSVTWVDRIISTFTHEIIDIHVFGSIIKVCIQDVLFDISTYHTVK